MAGAEDATTDAALSQASNEAGTKLRRRRPEAAAILLVNGMDVSAIAQMLEYPDETTCYKDIENAIAKIGLDSWDKQQLRQIMGARLEKAWQIAITNAGRRGYPAREAAMSNAIRAAERLIKLYGLDAPTEVVVHTATSEQINAWVASMLAEKTKALPEEKADVISGTVVRRDADVAELPRA